MRSFRGGAIYSLAVIKNMRSGYLPDHSLTFDLASYGVVGCGTPHTCIFERETSRGLSVSSVLLMAQHDLG